MPRPRITLYAATAALALTLGCGLPGAPQPPSLHVPRPVSDLHAEREGARVVLTWTPPRQTTDGVRLSDAVATRICRAVATLPLVNQPPTPPAACQQIAEVKVPLAASRARGTAAAEARFTDTLTPEAE